MELITSHFTEFIHCLPVPMLSVFLQPLTHLLFSPLPAAVWMRYLCTFLFKCNFSHHVLCVFHINPGQCIGGNSHISKMEENPGVGISLRALVLVEGRGNLKNTHGGAEWQYKGKGICLACYYPGLIPRHLIWFPYLNRTDSWLQNQE